MNDKIRPPEKVGDFDVFESAVEAMIRTYRSVVLVHAYASHRHMPDNCLYTWIEGRNGVYSELMMGSGMVEDYNIAKKEFYDRLKIEKIRRYTIPEMMNAILKHRHFGPWEFDEYLGDSRPLPLKKFAVSKSAAIHEAAHVVCALYYFPEDAIIHWVVVSPSGQNIGLCYRTIPSDPTVLAIASMAGVVAEMMLLRNVSSNSKRESCEAFISGNISKLKSYHNKGDVSDAIRQVHSASKNRNDIETRKSIMHQTRQIVRRLAPQIKVVAGALVKTPFLTGDEVYRLCGMKWKSAQN